MKCVPLFFSDSLVSKGDKWVIKTKLESGGTNLNMESTYELKETTDLYCLISGVSKLEPAYKDIFVENKWYANKI